MLKHKSVIRQKATFLHKQDLIVIMELCQGGELMDLVQEEDLPELRVRDILGQIISGVSACHQRGVIHRDLKLENVLFLTKRRQYIKIVDFGIAGMSKGGVHEENDAVTMNYMTPEVAKHEDVGADP